ncbi:bifunctional ADP-dependent NAD(P)H-hydrate dehydratase/NAD(P)H-hydrate epimerase [Cellulomonas sp. KRMCY2]|uniref:bifunctional ADP-dependent NAD(P)H-hydrate dehydratase/NAD(P)H-hydrate epimerase n=1 Tax=Cellulomonas sp. KRMCY2 TaxID=1304865 RepID=UPI00045E6399|nr:bifunctional ADP-dependent NAD(P)H-hydrate dehydratase/NAD(P)H-hydrate epimerase [Cellulomonas sp. KRMCY2]
MIEAFTAQDVRAAEEPLLATERGFSGGLMDHAAMAVELTVRRELRQGTGRVSGRTVVGLIGPGNNGGDTLHALARLTRHGVRTVAVTTSAAVHDGGLAALRAAGGVVLGIVPGAAGEQVWLGEALAEAFAADVVLDGLLGIGGHGGLRGTAAELVTLLDELLAGQGDDAAGGGTGRGGPLVVAVDVPSGIGVDDGTLPGPVLRADLTVTFGVPKAGLLLPPAAQLIGGLEVVDLGLAPVLSSLGRRASVSRLGDSDVRALWPVPGASAHKYTRGVVGVVAGSAAYPGAGVLTVAGALAAGAGMVRYLGPEAVRDAVLAAHPEAVTGGGRVQAWVIGPGLGDDDEQSGRAREALAHAPGQGIAVVVDAGALDLLPERVGPRTVLTPHAGELARLLTARGIDVSREQVQAEPLRWVREAQHRTGASVLLKGSTTVVAGPAGFFAQREAPSWLATAGAGDVLAGMLGAALAGRAAEVRADATVVARLAAATALVHGRAARAANPAGPVTASAVAAAVPQTIARLLAPGLAGGTRGARPRPHRAVRRVVTQ